MKANPIDIIRRSLGRTPESPLSPRPAIYPARQPESMEAEIKRFLAEIQLLSGQSKALPEDGIAEALRDLVADQKIHKATLWDTPLVKQLQIGARLQDLGVELVSPGEGKFALAQCDLGVTEADYAMPETGTLVLRSSANKPRAVSLLPRIHLAILTPSALRADMHPVFEEAKNSNYLVFITGPSRTSDIELITTLGVHGPKELMVFVVN